MQNMSSGASGGASADAEKSRHRNVIQREIMMKDADHRRSVNEKMQIETELRGLKNEEAHIRVSLSEKQGRLIKLEQDIKRLDGELGELKKKSNSL